MFVRKVMHHISWQQNWMLLVSQDRLNLSDSNPCFYLLNDNRWATVWQNGVWHESSYEATLSSRKILHPFTFIDVCWTLTETKQWMWARQRVMCFGSRVWGYSNVRVWQGTSTYASCRLCISLAKIHSQWWSPCGIFIFSQKFGPCICRCFRVNEIRLHYFRSLPRISKCNSSCHQSRHGSWKRFKTLILSRVGDMQSNYISLSD